MRVLDQIEATIRDRRTEVAYIHGSDRATFADLDRRANEIVRELLGCGLAPGARVGIRLQACVAYPAICIGIWRAGGAVVPLDPAIDDSELTYCLDVARVQYLIGPDSIDDSGTEDRGLAIQQLQPDSSIHSNNGPPDPSDFEILFSSGTTGRPKGIVHTHDSAGALVQRHISRSGLTPDDIVLATSLFNTGFGFHSYILEPLFSGAKVVIVHPFLPRAALDAVQREGVTWIQTVPAILKLLAAVNPPPMLPSLRTVRLGAATLDTASRDRFVANFGLQPIQGYGMNEIGRISATAGVQGTSTGRTVGLPEVDLRIFNDEGDSLPPGELGEIGLRAPSLCRPYYLMSGQQSEPLPFRDDYFLTGDLGRLSQDGVLELAGRRKTFILTPRYKVDPCEVESVLVQHPSVVEAAVVPEPGHAGYEAIKAVVVVATPTTPQELLSFCSDRLPMGKCPQTIMFVESLPRNALGKVEVGKFMEAQ